MMLTKTNLPNFKNLSNFRKHIREQTRLLSNPFDTFFYEEIAYPLLDEGQDKSETLSLSSITYLKEDGRETDMVTFASVDVPGIEKSDITVELVNLNRGKYLLIKAKKDEKEYKRSIPILSSNVTQDDIEVTYKLGQLHININYADAAVSKEPLYLEIKEE